MSSFVSKFCIDVRSTVDEFHMVMEFFNKEHLWVGEKYMVTYKKNVSLYVGDQLLFFDLVECLRFFPLRLGPTIFTSTNGRNIVPVKKNDITGLYKLIQQNFVIQKHIPFLKTNYAKIIHQFQ